jgi:hypothetical protein
LGSISDGATSEFPSLTERSQTVASSSQAAFRVIDAMNRNRQALDLFLLRRDYLLLFSDLFLPRLDLRLLLLHGMISTTPTRYFNEAYVVMEYFYFFHFGGRRLMRGTFRSFEGVIYNVTWRDPDAFYFDWLTTLNQTNDPRIMVFGFANSTEYRQRFGPP